MVLAVGRHGFMEGILSTVAISLAVFFSSLIIAAALVITTYKRRHQAQERLREEERLIRGERSSESTEILIMHQIRRSGPSHKGDPPLRWPEALSVAPLFPFEHEI